MQKRRILDSFSLNQFPYEPKRRVRQLGKVVPRPPTADIERNAVNGVTPTDLDNALKRIRSV